MFEKKYKRIVLVHNDVVCWVSNDADSRNRLFFQLPLEQVLDERAAPQLPEWLKGGSKTLCIVPDHWFGCSSFPFRSKKPSLIEPFLERKLTAANPGQKDIRHFFNYRSISNNGQGELFAIYFLEDKSYRLFDVLHKFNHTPQRVTSPAFIWEERLQQNDQEFNRLGTLLIHKTAQECQLYFYNKGNYQFSRSVMLSDGSDGLDALVFEINQSLYMFSQKAKSELDRIYLACDMPECKTRLKETLGREIIDVPTPANHWPDGIKIPGMEPLDGLLEPSQLSSGASFFSVIHRQIKQALEWRPVQLAGIICGLILLLGLAGEALFLSRLLDEDKRERQSIQQTLDARDTPLALSEYADALDQVLDQAAQSTLAQKVFGLPDAFMSQIRLKKLDLAMESPPTLKLAAYVQARNADELAIVLTRLIAQMKDAFEGARDFTLKDIDISLDPVGDGQTPNRYQIEFQLELT